MQYEISYQITQLDDGSGIDFSICIQMRQLLVDSETYNFSMNTGTLWGVGISLKAKVCISRDGEEY